MKAIIRYANSHLWPPVGLQEDIHVLAQSIRDHLSFGAEPGKALKGTLVQKLSVVYSFIKIWKNFILIQCLFSCSPKYKHATKAQASNLSLKCFGQKSNGMFRIIITYLHIMDAAIHAIRATQRTLRTCVTVDSGCGRHGAMILTKPKHSN